MARPQLFQTKEECAGLAWHLLLHKPCEDAWGILPPPPPPADLGLGRRERGPSHGLGRARSSPAAGRALPRQHSVSSQSARAGGPSRGSEAQASAREAAPPAPIPDRLGRASARGPSTLRGTCGVSAVPAETTSGVGPGPGLGLGNAGAPRAPWTVAARTPTIAARAQVVLGRALFLARAALPVGQTEPVNSAAGEGPAPGAPRNGSRSSTES